MVTPPSNVLSLPDAYHHATNDFRALCLSLGGAPSRVTSSATGRDVWRLPVIEHPGQPRPVSRTVDRAIFTDGIQARLSLTTRRDGTIPGDRREIWLDYVCAASVSDDMTLYAREDRFWVTASSVDGPWLASLDDLPPVWLLAEDLSDTLVPASERLVEATRVGLEDRVLAATQPPDGWLLVMDGSIRHRRRRPGLVGVVKSTGLRLLTDEQVLRCLPVAHRSPTITLPSGRVDQRPVLSAYVRLHEPTGASWTQGLIRVEADDEEHLERIAATAYAHRQPSTSNDARWDVHLAGIAQCEQVARTAMPDIFRVV